MIKYLYGFGRILLSGIYSLGNGLASMGLYPIEDVDISLRRSSFEEDYNAIYGDWEKIGDDFKTVGKDLEKIIKK